jgi:hypothetical protein
MAMAIIWMVCSSTRWPLAGVDMREVEYQEKIVVRLKKRPFHRWCHWAGFLLSMRIYSILQGIFNVPSAIYRMRY